MYACTYVYMQVHTYIMYQKKPHNNNNIIIIIIMIMIIINCYRFSYYSYTLITVFAFADYVCCEVLSTCYNAVPTQPTFVAWPGISSVYKWHIII